MNESDLRESVFVFTLGNVCTTFCMQNGVTFAFKRRNILNGREITRNFRENQRMITDFSVSGFDSALEDVFTTFCM